jgi:hypothetical protein
MPIIVGTVHVHGGLLSFLPDHPAALTGWVAKGDRGVHTVLG